MTKHELIELFKSKCASYCLDNDEEREKVAEAVLGLLSCPKDRDGVHDWRSDIGGGRWCLNCDRNDP